jgi:uncharacterized protein (TIGR03435 family)
VKPSPPPGSVMRVGCTGGPGTSDPGRISCERMNLRSLLMRAYDVKAYQISGPEWLTDVSFDIVASVAAGTTKEQVQQMWQHLLAERLKLTVHREAREMPYYALVVNKGGLKMAEVPDDAASGPTASGGGGGGGSRPSAAGGGSGFARATADRDGGTEPPGGRRGYLRGSKMQITQVLVGLTNHVDRPVIDQTGLTGRYKVDLEWTVDSDGSSPGIFSAVQEQLGLKLEPRKGPIDTLVIDHAEKVPTGN